MRVVLTQPSVRGTAQDNFTYVTRLLDTHRPRLESPDVIVLPELIGFGLTIEQYRNALVELASRYQAHIIGGSHFRDAKDHLVNQGLVVAPDGEVLASYEKANPYFGERDHGAGRGNGGAHVVLNGVACFVTICADFFHADTFMRFQERADIVFVTASSVSRKPTPDMARARWKHAMIARAFEQTAHVAVSDWAYPVGGQNELPASGVAGIAYPDAEQPDNLISTLGEAEIAVYDIDISRGRMLFADQEARGFAIAGTRGHA
ncbi:carbon-nitrogen hydrolase family protein [Devosia sp. WQ 349]|uniref:carbon-nitrogen hydrolase family protein n=1 Tax=Devosia sp. WQ 349K1 TaxID=2800329 RepID=UPI001903914F|nr:carbon-nitrogen hydrolase family protein [Devosia sp. WQ 349K1]MBK1794649.1 carbon-nitrogen hydrolase family protein [Devosia sp. WQ 349K1]